MQTNSNHDTFLALMKLAADGAQWLLRQGVDFQPIFLYVANDELVGCVTGCPDESGDHFVDTIRHLAIAQNVTEGVLVGLFEGRSESAPAGPAREFVMLVYQSRTRTLTYLAPVHRAADGTFLHLGRNEQAHNVPGLDNIVPEQEPGEAERLASKLVVQNRKLVIQLPVTAE
jgi:hypothetical protein